MEELTNKHFYIFVFSIKIYFSPFGNKNRYNRYKPVLCLFTNSRDQNKKKKQQQKRNKQTTKKPKKKKKKRKTIQPEINKPSLKHLNKIISENHHRYNLL